MERILYDNKVFSDDHVVDPSQEFDFDLQQALLGDCNISPSDCFYFSCDEELHLKNALFDEDEGFNEECDEEVLSIATGLLDSQEQGRARGECDAGVDLFDPVNSTMATASGCNVASYPFAGSHDQYELQDHLPGNSLDNCYGMWTSNSSMELISAKDHMISPDTLHDIEQFSGEPSPLMEAEDNFDIKQSSDIQSKEEIVNMPFYKFKRFLDNPLLSADDKQQVKAIRKKGKNKSAARHCRQRKMETLEGLEHEVASLQQQQSLLAQQKAQLIAETKFWESKCASFHMVDL